MAISLASLIRTGQQKKPARIMAHGVQGVGKTTFAAGAPNPVLIRCEDGTGKLDIEAFPLARSYDDVMGAITALYQEDHAFGTVIVDSADWLEPLIYAKACEDNKWGNIEEPGYGKGYIAAMSLWRQYIEGLNALRDDKGMWVIQIAHTDIKRFESPDTEAYDRYVIKLYNKASALLLEHSDTVLFVNYQVSIRETAEKFGQKRKRAVGGGQRIVYTEERPAFVAKNRYGLPDSIIVPDENWAPVWEALHAAVGV
jgi:hypothetical protein